MARALDWELGLAFVWEIGLVLVLPAIARSRRPSGYMDQLDQVDLELLR